MNGSPVIYDDWGNIIARNGQTYVYNSSNQLIRVSNDSNILGEYFYNSEGKRYKKVEGGSTSYYIYGGERLLYKQVGSSTNICYIYLNGRTVAKVVSNDTDASKYYYHTDHLGQLEKLLILMEML